MSELRRNLPPLPARMRGLPLDARGYPVPKFVEWIDGKPDFRVMSAHHFKACVERHLCWLCGVPLGKFKAFVIGPMCALNLVSAEPPSHRDCAIFAATACPFLTLPKAQRREAGLPANRVVNDLSIPRNPGVALVWVTQGYKVLRERGGILFRVGEPAETLWFAEGRPATRAEVEESIDSGLPLLEEAVRKYDPPEALEHLRLRRVEVGKMLPAKVSP